MSFESILSFGLWATLLLFTLAYLGQRSRARRRAGKASRFGFYPTGQSLGNALQQLQLFTQPRVEHTIQMQLDAETDEDDSGELDHPEAVRRHLLREANRIRRSHRPRPLTTRLPRGRLR